MNNIHIGRASSNPEKDGLLTPHSQKGLCYNPFHIHEALICSVDSFVNTCLPQYFFQLIDNRELEWSPYMFNPIPLN